LTLERYEKYAAGLVTREALIDDLKELPEILSIVLQKTLQRAQELPKFELALYLTTKFLVKMEEELFPPEQRAIRMEELLPHPKEALKALEPKRPKSPRRSKRS
jgi:hypothetical protein